MKTMLLKKPTFLIFLQFAQRSMCHKTCSKKTNKTTTINRREDSHKEKDKISPQPIGKFFKLIL